MENQVLTEQSDAIEVEHKSDKKIILAITGVIIMLFVLVTAGSLLSFKYLTEEREGLTRTRLEEFLDGFSQGAYQKPQELPKVTVEETVEKNKSHTSESTSSIYVTPDTTLYNNKVNLRQDECIRYLVEIEGFQSNYCYSFSDYSNLVMLNSKYQQANRNKKTAESRIEILCNGNEFFEDNCDDAKGDLNTSKQTMEETKNQIQVIISRGIQ